MSGRFKPILILFIALVLTTIGGWLLSFFSPVFVFGVLALMMGWAKYKNPQSALAQIRWWQFGLTLILAVVLTFGMGLLVFILGPGF